MNRYNLSHREPLAPGQIYQLKWDDAQLLYELVSEKVSQWTARCIDKHISLPSHTIAIDTHLLYSHYKRIR